MLANMITILTPFFANMQGSYTRPNAALLATSSMPIKRLEIKIYAHYDTAKVPHIQRNPLSIIEVSKNPFLAVGETLVSLPAPLFLPRAPTFRLQIARLVPLPWFEGFLSKVALRSHLKNSASLSFMAFQQWTSDEPPLLTQLLYLQPGTHCL